MTSNRNYRSIFADAHRERRVRAAIGYEAARLTIRIVPREPLYQATNFEETMPEQDMYRYWAYEEKDAYDTKLYEQ